MRRVIKKPDSKILTEKLHYLKGNTANNRKIAEILLQEQKKFCAYTDEYISRTDAADIEHFNPTLKATTEDGYNNLFLVKHLWNKEKSAKWENFQPILHPTATDFEERVIYIKGDYIARSDQDTAAKNLIGLLQLDDPALAEKRKKYLERKRKDMQAYNEGASAFFSTLISDDNCQISYPRAINEEFGIDVWELL